MRISTSIKNIDFENSFKKHYSPLCNFAYSYINEQELCQDLVQDVFLKIWDNPPSINSSMSSYLYRAVKNACLDHIKKSYNLSILPIEEVEDPIDTPIEINKEDKLNEINLKIEKAINSLPPKCKEVFIMRRNMQLSYDEISDKLNISKKTIENHMNSAIKKLRSQLSKSDLLIYFFLIGKKTHK